MRIHAAPRRRGRGAPRERRPGKGAPRERRPAGEAPGRPAGEAPQERRPAGEAPQESWHYRNQNRTKIKQSVHYLGPKLSKVCTIWAQIAWSFIRFWIGFRRTQLESFDTTAGLDSRHQTHSSNAICASEGDGDLCLRNSFGSGWATVSSLYHMNHASAPVTLLQRSIYII